MDLTFRFFMGYNAFRDRPDMKALVEQVSAYRSELKYLRLEDNQVKKQNLGTLRILINIIQSVVRMSFSIVFALPGFIMLAPLGFFLRFLAEKERLVALAGSSVKIVGVDVMATRKIVSSLVLYPPLCLFFTAIFWAVGGYYELPFRWLFTIFFPILFPFYSYS
jgi:glycerol-3-phosphate O-acyltransferase/dihydroxyacetone phosphate acyltransferase